MPHNSFRTEYSLHRTGSASLTRRPVCGNDEMLLVEATCMDELTIDGLDFTSDLTWDESSFAECPDCHHAGTIKEFYVWEPAAIASQKGE